MKKHLAISFFVLIVLAVIITACAAPATPTAIPKPTQPPTQPPPPTTQPTVPPTPIPPTLAPTQTPSPVVTLTPLPPPATPLPPTRTPIPATRRPAATATAPKPPDPRGSIAYHVNANGIDGIRVINLGTNIVTPLIDTGPVIDIMASTNAHMVEWSPDGTKVAYVVTSGTGGSNVLRVLDFPTNVTKSLFSGEPGGGLSSPTWSPDGSKIAFIRMRGPNQVFWGINTINADGSGRSEILTNTQGEQFRGGISWSKLGVLAIARNLNGPNEVYSLFADGGGLTNLSRNPTAEDTTPVWSPDGKLIAFMSTRDGLQQIYVMNADGSGARRVSQGGFNDVSPAWSPDGNWIAFTSFRQGAADIFIMDLRGGNVKRITSGGGDRPSWSR